MAFLHKLSHAYQRAVRVVAAPFTPHCCQQASPKAASTWASPDKRFHPSTRSPSGDDLTSFAATGRFDNQKSHVTVLRFNSREVGAALMTDLKKSIYRKVEA